MTEQYPLLIDTGEACTLIFGSKTRKNYYRLYEMIDREEIAGTKIGGRWFIPGKAMQKFIDDIADA